MRALVFSDVHANLEALQAVLSAAGVDRASAGSVESHASSSAHSTATATVAIAAVATPTTTYDAIWNLGDIVGYGGNPNEATDIVRSIATAHVRGNHDKVCCGVESALSFNPVARSAAAWTSEALSTENTAWLRDLPLGPAVIESFSAVIAHGSPLDEDLYILNIRDAWAALANMQHRVTFFGHTHVQGGFSWKNGVWREVHPSYRGHHDDAVEWTLKLEPDTQYLLNPGSVGQPRDGDWRSCFAVLDKAADTVTFHRVPYDLARAQGHILMANLPERLATRLRDGR